MESIEFLEAVAKIDCGCLEEENHDCDECPSCEARRILNDIGEIAEWGVTSVQKKLLGED